MPHGRNTEVLEDCDSFWKWLANPDVTLESLEKMPTLACYLLNQFTKLPGTSYSLLVLPQAIKKTHQFWRLNNALPPAS